MGKISWIKRVLDLLYVIIFSEMAVILLEGSRVSSEKIKSTGFKFKYSFLLEALKDLNT